MTQDIGLVGLDVEAVNVALAGAVRELFTAVAQGLSGPDHVSFAMDFLRNTLAAMQEVGVEDASLEAATATVARTLAILFPVLKALEAMVCEPEPIPLTSAVIPPGAIPLTQARKSPPSEAPHDAGRERRLAERKAFEVDIGIQSDTNFFTGFSMDISSGGLFVATYDIADVGTGVNINFAIPSGPMMSLDGVVRWVREYNDTVPEMAPGMGVMFENLTPAQEDAINSYLARSSPLFFDA